MTLRTLDILLYLILYFMYTTKLNSSHTLDKQKDEIMNVYSQDICQVSRSETANFGSSVYSISHFFCQSLQLSCLYHGKIIFTYFSFCLSNA